MFARSVYVGYTATPFANIFIHPYADASSMGPAWGTDAERRRIGQDLFPKHFILNLPAPSNYIGPVQVFGLGEETDRPLDKTGLPIVRIIDDYHNEFPAKHDQHHLPSSLPPSLKSAIRCFILTCAIRASRGQGSEHNSMLVHVTRFVNVQEATASLIESELKTLQNRLLFGDGERQDSVLDELRLLWETDVLPTTTQVEALVPDPRITKQDWHSVEPHLRLAASKITVKKINGTALDVLDYYGNPDGISVIAVGGDKLSRGLTLEGLSISYYLRASKMYDTLMQMGRWFGYRPGYADLCRLYTTKELRDWYRHITIASEELRSEFDEMVRAGQTPEEFGLKVRTHPGGMVVTGAGKLRNSTLMRVSFSGRLIESYRISSRRTNQSGNHLAAAAFVASLGLPSTQTRSGTYVWKAQNNSLAIMSFLRDLTGYPQTLDFAPSRLAEFIENLNQDDELTDWTVCLINVRQNKLVDFAGLSVGCSDRSLTFSEEAQLLEVGQRHIISMEHEWLDMLEEEKKKAELAWLSDEKNKGKDLPGSLTGSWARKVRPNSRGLLLLYLLDPKDGPQDQVDLPYLGYAISFPQSKNGEKRAVSYVVNNIYAKEEFED